MDKSSSARTAPGGACKIHIKRLICMMKPLLELEQDAGEVALNRSTVRASE